ncbi:MAG: hypothetical protein IPH07_38795 [Deltaproteobacteria bacterium]|nr:hypothetical protein [Deltaproteobacteria bacterium]MBK8236176.1 hypothetical protein [Deltaproteobacteria bacterium]MBP7290269.1 hypothetical protein [Nannocystaceae bacterium]
MATREHQLRIGEPQRRGLARACAVLGVMVLEFRERFGIFGSPRGEEFLRLSTQLLEIGTWG